MGGKNAQHRYSTLSAALGVARQIARFFVARFYAPLQRAIYFYFTVLPGDIRPIERDGITITFNYRPIFSNVLDIAITARNSNPVTLHQVVMGLDVPTVSLQSFLHILKCHIYNN